MQCSAALPHGAIATWPFTQGAVCEQKWYSCQQSKGLFYTGHSFARWYICSKTINGTTRQCCTALRCTKTALCVKSPIGCPGTNEVILNDTIKTNQYQTTTKYNMTECVHVGYHDDITGSLWEKSTSHQWILLTKGQLCEIWCFAWCHPKKNGLTNCWVAGDLEHLLWHH